jgi:NADPH:quinone reductase-like Zn-dependent oxidoreductase
MKAILLQGYGSVDELVYEDVPIPVAAAGEVLVKLLATSVNPIDYKVRRGDMKNFMPLKLPAILGRDLAGKVIAVGEGVTAIHEQALVMALANQTYAEYVSCKADILAPIPEGLDPVEAGVLPLILTTGTQLIEQGVAPTQGQRLLVTGALGSVGRTAVYVAKQHGAYVIAGVRGKQREEAEALGADEILALDDETALKNLRELDAIADTVGGDLIAQLIPRIRRNGILATVVGKPKSAEGHDVQVHEVYAQPDAKRLGVLAQAVAAKALNIPISERMKLKDIRQAHKLAEKGAGGKILLTP